VRAIKSTQDPSFRVAQRLVQELKLEMARVAPVQTALIGDAAEARAVATYLVALQRGQGPRFQAKKRRSWQLVCRVLARAPQER
jgi:hypothetical protein